MRLFRLCLSVLASLTAQALCAQPAPQSEDTVRHWTTDVPFSVPPSDVIASAERDLALPTTARLPNFRRYLNAKIGCVRNGGILLTMADFHFGAPRQYFQLFAANPRGVVATFTVYSIYVRDLFGHRDSMGARLADGAYISASILVHGDPARTSYRAGDAMEISNLDSMVVMGTNLTLRFSTNIDVSRDSAALCVTASPYAAHTSLMWSDWIQPAGAN